MYYQLTFKTRIALQMTDGLKPVVSTIDQDGEIKDRTKDLMVEANGFQVALESALMAHLRLKKLQ
jgi:hypothetical protein